MLTVSHGLRRGIGGPRRSDASWSVEAVCEEPRHVGELAAGQPVSRPAVSQHLKVLEDAGLVRGEARGNRRLYTARREGIDELRRYLTRFWSDALDAYGAEVSRRLADSS